MKAQGALGVLEAQVVVEEQVVLGAKETYDA